jgi:2-methylcitrate dehydratase
MSSPISNVRPPADPILQLIADYVADTDHQRGGHRHRALLPDGQHRLRPARPEVSGLHQDARPAGTGGGDAGRRRVLGLDYELDPVRSAFNNGALIRWLDFNDTWLAAEWGHPSDNLGGILAVADWMGRAGAGKEFQVPSSRFQVADG